MNDCDCHSIPPTTLARVLSTDPESLEAYELAKRRIIQDEQDEERQNTSTTSRRRELAVTRLEKLHRVVVDALSRGGYVACPQCKQHGQKNDACMHMQCSNCGTRYCYCCGRERGDTLSTCRSDGNGCDYPSPYLENHRGWTECRINEEESEGMGALHEFHRRRMAYFLRQVKSNYPNELWDELRQMYPNLLNDTPTDGRRIDWDDLDSAEPPLFGITTVDQLEWRDGGLCACTEGIEDEEPNLETRPPRQQESEQREQPPRAEERPGEVVTMLEHHKALVACWIFGFVLAVILLSCRAVNESQALRIVGNLLVALLAGSGLPILAMAIVDWFASNPNNAFCGTLCCAGRNNEPPYLASNGRWHQYRVLYWYIVFGGIALASVCIAGKRLRLVHGFGIFLLTDILFSYCSFAVIANSTGMIDRQPLPSATKWTLLRIGGWITVLSIGSGILAACGDSYNANATGKAFFAFGFAGGVAEFLAGSFKEGRDGEAAPFTRTHGSQLLLSYCAMFGVASGSLMVGLSESPSALTTTGIIIILLAGILLIYDCVRPCVAH